MSIFLQQVILDLINITVDIVRAFNTSWSIQYSYMYMNINVCISQIPAKYGYVL